MTEQERDWVQDVGAPAYASIAEMVAALECDYERMEELRDERDNWTASTWATENPDDDKELKDLEDAAGECESREEAKQRIEEYPLSLRIFNERVGGEWTADRFELLLSTGGPAVRIMGELDGNTEPYRAWLEVQDWYKPWTQYFPADQDTLLAYCRCFCPKLFLLLF